ncbi:MAG: CCA tRNA nucleotidyltransferase [Treponema sp.]|jgi:tRNA nucleotidyltransferase/poly(A) polymerase|nr:CCA tRNA nucleotidyltransferase [Treponema sp.]
MIRIHPILKEIAALFAARKKEVCLVGGAVRDMIRREAVQDWDIATNALPAEVTAIFRGARPPGRVFPTGIKHGTITALYRGRSLEITTYRTEAGYSDGRRPDTVRYAATIEEDLSRRDFTMNAIALRLPGGETVDPFGGEADIRARIIRCVGKAEERFSEDGLRPLRAVRFAAQLGFELEQHTEAAIPAALSVSAKVSRERVRGELDKILASPRPSRALSLMEKTGLMELFLPELAACRGVEQKGFHRFDVLDHSLLACDYAAGKQYPPEVRAAALLHDTGKTVTRKMEPEGVWSFYRHEAESEKIARNILGRLRYPGAFIDAVCLLVKEHMFHYTGEWTDAAVRRFIVRAGEANLENLYRLRMADACAMAGAEPPPDFLLPLARRVDRVLSESRALSLKDLAVSGKDLMAAGIAPGKTMGIILNELLETVLDDPAQNARERLLEIAGELNGKLKTGLIRKPQFPNKPTEENPLF